MICRIALMTTKPHSKMIPYLQNTRWGGLENFSINIFSRDLHSEHRKKSNNSRFKEGNPVNESTILERETIAMTRRVRVVTREHLT